MFTISTIIDKILGNTRKYKNTLTQSETTNISDIYNINIQKPIYSICKTYI